MKDATPELIALLATRQFYVVDLFVFTLIDGTVLRYCGGDMDVQWNGNNYSCGGMTGPFFQKRGGNRGLCKWKLGVDVDTLQFDVIPGSGQIEGFDFLQACKLGLFDGAELDLYRAFTPEYNVFVNPAPTVELEDGSGSEGLESGGAVQLETIPSSVVGGVVLIFPGRVVEIDCGRSLATFNINSHLELLTQQMPRNLYQPGCLNTLFDSACTLNSSSFAVSGTVGSGTTVSMINASLSQDTGYFNQGRIVFTSGDNDGFTRTIKSYTTGGTINLLVPLPYTPSVSDTFTIYPGCDKTMTTCATKFSNIANFRGQPFIPAPETGV
jgi:hypothetical protein